jgi:hypothetical protein
MINRQPNLQSQDVVLKTPSKNEFKMEYLSAEEDLQVAQKLDKKNQVQINTHEMFFKNTTFQERQMYN